MTKSKMGLGLLLVLVASAASLAFASAKAPKTAKPAADSDTTVLSSSTLLILNAEVTGESTNEVLNKARQLDAELTKKGDSTTPLILWLKTPGGSIEAGLELSTGLQGLGRPVITITAFAASMGFQLVQNLGKRLILDKGVLMSHHAYGASEGSYGGVSPNQMQQRQHLSDQMVLEMDQQTVNRTNGKQTLESYIKLYDKEVWMTGHESVAGGFADQITKVRCDDSIVGTTTKHTTFMGMPVDYDLDNCPINSSPINVRLANPAGMSNEILSHVKNQFLSNYINQFSAGTQHPLYW